MVGRDTEGTCRVLLCGWILCTETSTKHQNAFPACLVCSRACLESGVCLEHAFPSPPPTLDRGWLLKALSGQLCFA